MHLKRKGGFVLVHLIYILFVLTFLSSLVLPFILNNLRVKDAKPYMMEISKDLEKDKRISTLNFYIKNHDGFIEGVKNSGNNESINEDIFLKYVSEEDVYRLTNGAGEVINLKHIRRNEENYLVPSSFNY